MKLWRKIVSVLAGTMIAAGSVLAVASVMETAPLGGSPNPSQTANLDVPSARTTTQDDAQALANWLEVERARDQPTRDTTHTAALGAGAYRSLTGATVVRGNATQQPAPATQEAIQGSYPNEAAVTDAALDITTSPNASTGGAPDAQRLDYAFAFVTLSNAATPGSQLADTVEGRFSSAAPAVVNAVDFDTDAYFLAGSTDEVALVAGTDDVPAYAWNWSQSASDELDRRFDGGLLETDTLNVSLASQAFRDDRPAEADALNAELRFRQQADGSIGDVVQTSEAARALAMGGTVDQQATVRALNWLDAQGPLAPELAVHRMRAHAFDGRLPRYATGGSPATPPPLTSGGPSAFGLSSAEAAGVDKGALGLWLLFGGIGLSLSLVTVDALKGSRQRLYESIRASPGLHVNELRRRLHMSPSSIEYHLSVLVGAGLVVAEEDGRYKRYYANGAGLGLNPRSPHSRNTLGALRRPHAVVLVRELLARQAGATASELSAHLSIHESAAARRLDHLEDAGVLVSQRRGRSRIFQVRDAAAALHALASVEEAPPIVATEDMAAPADVPVARAGSPPAAH